MTRIYQKKTDKISFLKNRSYICMLFILTSVFSFRANATTFPVSNTNDAGAGSLRQAILDANANPGADIVDATGVTGTIILTTGQIAISESLTINGPGMNLLTINQTTDARIFSTGSGAVTFLLQDLTLNFTGPGTTPYSGGGGAIVAGGAGASTTLINVTISNFKYQIGNGGAISQSSGLNTHSLTITNCIFTDNKCGGAGGAVSFNSQGGTLTITGCTFTNNHTGLVGVNPGGDGGAIATTGGGSGGTYLIEKNTFLNNQVENVTGHAGAIMNTNGALTVQYNRFFGNSCLNVANPPLANIIGQAGGATVHTTVADNNWWGVNTGPGANDAAALAAGGTMTLTRWLQLKNTASPSAICVPNNSTITASFLSNNLSEAIAPANLTALVGLPITFNAPVNGTLSAAQTSIQAAGTATVIFTATAGGNGSANAVFVPLAENFTTTTNPTITISTSSTAPTGVTGTTTICNGGNTTLTVSGGVKGTGAITEWFTGSCGGTPAGTGDAINVSPTATTTYFVRYNGPCNTTTCATVTVTVNDVTGGILAADQTICSGGDPAAFTETVGSTGSGALTYQWQSSTISCAAGFFDIAGATGITYDAPSGLAVTTFYRRVITSTLNSVLCTANSNCITVTVNNVTGGTVATDQTICSGGDPAAFTQTVASTGSGTLTYQWQSSTISCAAGFSDIVGATGTTYDAPSGLAVTTFYKRVTTSILNAVACTANSNCVTITVTPNNTITLTSAPGTTTQSVLINTPITNITYSTTGATGATISGLPAGVNGNWAANVVTISGTPTASGIFNYTVTLTGGCGSITANGSITVIVCSISLSSAPGTDAQTVCNNSPITNITYGTTGATGATFSGLPAGVSGTWAANVVTISGTPSVFGTFSYIVTTTGGGCTGSVTATGTITVNPVPNVNPVANQNYCAGASVPLVVFTSSVGGAVFSWSRTVPTPDIGLGLNSGTGNVPAFTATNTSNAPITATFSVVASYTNNGVTCTGTPIQFTITVNPTPNAVATPSSQTICSASAITTIALSGNVSGTTFNWTRDNTVTVTGIAASGSGNISGTLTNTTNAPVTVTFTITPTANGCPGTPITATVLVNPTPNAVATPSSQTICSAGTITTIALTGNVAGTTYNWTRDNTVTVTGIAASGSGNISGTLTNTTNAPVTVTFTITPTASGCPGAPITATVLVNPTPNASAAPASQTICSGSAITPIVLSSTTTGANAIVNGGFETGALPPWTIGSAIPAPVVNATSPRTGTFAAFLGSLNGGPEPLGDASIYQTISVPAAGGTLSFWYRGFTTDGIAFDWQDAYISNTSGAILATIMHVCVTNAAYVQVNYNMAAFAGQTVRVVFLVHQDGFGDVTNMYVDDVTLSSPAVITYNWTRDNNATVTGIAASGSGTPITGTLTNTTFAPVTVTFTITPTSNGCIGTPTTATVLVNPTPNAIATPASQTICSGTAITPIVLTSSVAGTTYAWTRNNTVAVTGIAASGTGNISGTLTNTTTAPVTVTFTITPTANGCPGTPITATVIVQAPLAITCPAPITVPSIIGGCTAVVTYAPVVTGTPAPAFTYSFSGATTGSGNGTGSGATFNVGVTTVTITATNICSTVNCSFTITVTDSQLPVITTQPANTTVCAGSNASFSVVATNTLSYQWQSWNGSAWNNIAGATASTLTLNAVTFSMNTNSYRVIVTGLCSSVTSGFASLYVNQLPTISLVASRSPALLPGQVLNITTVVSPGGGTYVWKKNGVVIAGATGSSLNGLTVSDIGTYTCTYTDLNGCVSTSAALNVTGQVSDGLYIYPVPNDGRFHVRFYNDPNEEVTIKVIDMNGRLVYEKKVVTTIAYTDMLIDITTTHIISTETYIVEVIGPDGRLIGAKKIQILK